MFRGYENDARKQMNSVEIAEVCHRVNRAYCRALGDNSQPTWEDAPDWQRDSAIAGVELYLTNPRTPQEQHEAWMARKIDEGWVYDEIKDPAIKHHPCLVPWSELPVTQKAKDFILTAIVEALKGA